MILRLAGIFRLLEAGSEGKSENGDLYFNRKFEGACPWRVPCPRLKSLA